MPPVHDAPTVDAPTPQDDALTLTMNPAGPPPSFEELAHALLMLDRDMRDSASRRTTDPRVVQARKAFQEAQARLDEAEKPYADFRAACNQHEARLRQAVLEAWPEPDVKTIRDAAPGLTLQRKTTTKILVRDDVEAVKVLRNLDILRSALRKVEFEQSALKDAHRLGLLTASTIDEAGHPVPLFHVDERVTLAVGITETEVA